MSYSDFGREFIERTKQIFEQYENDYRDAIEKDNGYEITLLLNCMLGLLLFPEQRYFDNLNQSNVTFEDVIKGISGITVTGQHKTFRNGVIDLRNTIAHIADNRSEYISNIMLNNKSLSVANDIGKITKIAFMCGEKNNNFTINIDFEENPHAFWKMLSVLSDNIIKANQ